MSQPKIDIHGTCHPDFEPVKRAFIKNFNEHNDLGASVCVTREQELVVDLWAGVADEETGQPWQRDTKSVIWSTTKGLVAMCALLLAQRGQLDLFAPVTKYWPEYGKNGKENTLVAHLLCHQAGVCVVTETIPRNGVFNWELMVRMIENQAPQFEPGTRVGYSALMYGWLVGEVVRRVSGKSLGNFFREDLAGPLGADCWIGLPEDREAEMAKMSVPTQLYQGDFLDQPGFEIARVLFSNSGGYTDFSRNEGGHLIFDSRDAHAAEIGGGGGIANARGLARIYSPWANDGMDGSKRILDRDTLMLAERTISGVTIDATLRHNIRFSMGFQKSWDNRANPAAATVLMGERAFGFAGNGGSIGFADPEARMSFGYTMNRMVSMNVFTRAQCLMDAAYGVMGFHSNAAGSWRR